MSSDSTRREIIWSSGRPIPRFEPEDVIEIDIEAIRGFKDDGSMIMSLAHPSTLITLSRFAEFTERLPKDLQYQMWGYSGGPEEWVDEQPC